MKIKKNHVFLHTQFVLSKKHGFTYFLGCIFEEIFSTPLKSACVYRSPHSFGLARHFLEKNHWRTLLRILGEEPIQWVFVHFCRCTILPSRWDVQQNLS